MAPGNETQQMLNALHDCTLAVRIVPGPPIISPLVYARIRYEMTGQRQWIVATTVELLN
jgi:hypothetical protein